MKHQDYSALRQVGLLKFKAISYFQVNLVTYQVELLASIKVHPIFHVSLL